ncbi:MAG: hypothetical protein ACP6IS_04740 [Candidatus Asgardarchaeia archaeon]
MGALSRLKSLIFGSKKKGQVKREEAIASIIETIEIMETRSREYENRALKAREKAKLALKRNNEALAKQHLRDWLYSNRMSNQYRNIAMNLQQQLDRIRQATDMQRIAQELSKVKQIYQEITQLTSAEQAMKDVIEVNVMSKKVDAAMKVFSKQLGLPTDMEANELLEQEMGILQEEIAAEAIGGLPLPGEEVEEKEITTTKKKESLDEKSDEEEIKELLDKLKKEASKEKE